MSLFDHLKSELIQAFIAKAATDAVECRNAEDVEERDQRLCSLKNVRDEIDKVLADPSLILSVSFVSAALVPDAVDPEGSLQLTVAVLGSPALLAATTKHLETALEERQAEREAKGCDCATCSAERATAANGVH